MAPEEFRRATTIDERSTVFNLGRAAFLLMGGAGRGQAAADRWRASDALYQVASTATCPDPAAALPVRRRPSPGVASRARLSGRPWLRSAWRIRPRYMEGCCVLHDDGRVVLRPRDGSGADAVLAARQLNLVMDTVAERFGTLHFDAAGDAETYDPRMWAADRLHPSERGHRLIARRYHGLLAMAVTEWRSGRGHDPRPDGIRNGARAPVPLCRGPAGSPRLLPAGPPRPRRSRYPRREPAPVVSPGLCLTGTREGTYLNIDQISDSQSDSSHPLPEAR